ncbi:hypothetical protein GPECTOR_65g178 [Gonium pectorale]|uniref:Uncharacterized protein n=1 Tax=Gonium pectorale TaxID=33097 RepID=A0A150G5F7_GONPE|nr:hypothetical protein GPECTOR_65g178 [Gonium pectorale]|eukprot:KXZ44560.1 hypothetical protein GPECTOR_65g178 [Gonium pectorale]
MARGAREYLDPIRECYEAFVIYSFFAYLMAFLQDSLGDLEEHLAKKPPVQHMWGVRWLLKPWDMSTRFLWECKKINFNKSYVYLAAVTNFSQLWALYCLVQLYSAMHAELAPIRPLSKFLCIKAVVFVTFWQGIGIALLVYFGVIRRESWTTYDKMDVASGIQDFLICIEMFLAALAHAYAFPPRDYMAGHSKGFFSNVRYIFDLRDVVDDVGLVVEEHVSSATSAVVTVPQRAVKKVAKNIKKQFAGAAGSRRLVDEEEEEASKCALLSPAAGSAGSAGSGRGGAGRHGSSGGSAGEGLLTSGSYGASGSLGRELLTAPIQHLMLQEMEPAGGGGPVSPPAGRYSPLPPLPPAAAALTGVGGVGGSAFNSLVSTALYHTRAGFGEPQAGGTSSTAAAVGGSGRGVVGRRRSGGGNGGSGEYQLPGIGGAAAPSAASGPEYGYDDEEAVPSTSGGVEVPLVAVPHSGGYAASTIMSASSSGSAGSGGGSGSGVRAKVKEALGRGVRSVGALAGGGGSGPPGGGVGGDDAPYERLPTSSRRAHDE